MKLWSPMLHPLLSRSPDRVRTLLIVLLAPLALLGVVLAGHILLIPLVLAIGVWPAGPARWVFFAATVLSLCFLSRRSVRETLAVWHEARAIAIDQIMFAIGCIIWAAAAAFLVVNA